MRDDSAPSSSCTSLLTIGFILTPDTFGAVSVKPAPLQKNSTVILQLTQNRTLRGALAIKP